MTCICLFLPGRMGPEQLVSVDDPRHGLFPASRTITTMHGLLKGTRTHTRAQIRSGKLEVALRGLQRLNSRRTAKETCSPAQEPAHRNSLRVPWREPYNRAATDTLGSSKAYLAVGPSLERIVGSSISHSNGPHCLCLDSDHSIFEKGAF